MKFFKCCSWSNPPVVRYLVFAAVVSASGIFIDSLSAEAQKPKRKTAEVETTTNLSSEALHKRFMSLRNTDPHVRKLSEWTLLAHDYEDACDQKPTAALYSERAVIYRERGRATEVGEDLRHAVELFEELAKRFQSSPLADDALVYAAEIQHDDLKNYQAAKDLYQEIVKDFPRGDMIDLARARLSAPGEESGNSSENVVHASQSSLPVVVLDPGHGGEDFGAQTDFGLLEKDVVLSIALEVERQLTQRYPLRVVLTRRSDTFVPLLDRVKLANTESAKMFVSLHVNASGGPKVSGLETFVLDTSDNESSKLLAERENKSGGADVSDLDFMLSDITQTSKQPESVMLANTLQKSIMGMVHKSWKDAHDLGVKHAPFYVLVGAHMPCVLTEMFFIDNSVDSAKLVDRQFRAILAEGITTGIVKFLASQGMLGAS